MRRTVQIIVVVLVVGLAAAAGPAAAQGIWTGPVGDRSLTLEFVAPNIERLDLTTFSRTLFLGGRMGAADKPAFVFEVPFVYAKGDGAPNSEKAFGNIYLGGEVGARHDGFSGEFGLRVPTAPEDNPAILVGAMSDYLDRFEAFLPEIFTGVVAAKYRYRHADGFAMSVRMAPTFWFDQGDMLADGTEGWLLTTVQILADLEQVAVGGGYGNRLLLTEDEPGLSERMEHQLTFFANLWLNGWRPGLQVRVPLGDLGDALESSVALSIGYDFP